MRIEARRGLTEGLGGYFVGAKGDSFGANEARYRTNEVIEMKWNVGEVQGCGPLVFRDALTVFARAI